MGITKWFLFLAICAGFDAAAQTRQPATPVMLPLHVQAKDFDVDNLGNIYLVTVTNQLIKYDAKGDSVATFNDTRKYGALYSIDVTNPLKILLHYQDFGTLLVLERFLTQRTTIDLRRLNIMQAKAYCLSYDNHIWVYDELAGRIRKIDENGTALMESADLRLALEASISPERMIDKDGKLYLYDDETGFYVFDYFGALQNKIPLLGWKHLTIEDGRIYGTTIDGLISYDTKTHIQTLLSFIDPSATGKTLYKNQKLYRLGKDNKITITALENKKVE